MTRATRSSRARLGAAASRLWAALAEVKMVRRATRRVQTAELQLIEQSGLFDRDWYLRFYPDVEHAGLDPVRHYLDMGWREGRDPGPAFATISYLKTNPDVARNGINPLLHFLEFGRFEGRGSFGASPVEDEGEAKYLFSGNPAPCLSVPIRVEPHPSWRRSYRLDDSRGDCVKVGSSPVGYAENGSQLAAIQRAIATFSVLSGCAGNDRIPKAGELPRSDADLLDAWFVNACQLRMRLTADAYPLVVRAFQRDSSPDGTACLLGEGLICGPLDVVDLQLVNGWFPILLCIADPNGALRGSRLLPFPSLCRGGLHYPELLSTAEHGPGTAMLSPTFYGEYLAARLLRLIYKEEEVCISEIAVDLTGASATEPLFHPDFQTWVARVARVSVAFLAGTGDSIASRYLRDAVAVRPDEPRGGSGATLTLGAHMLPTLAILTQARAPRLGKAVEERFLAFVVAGTEPPDPVTVIAPPADPAAALQGLSGIEPSMWPRLRGRAKSGDFDSSVPGAIHFVRADRLTDAELLAPIAPDPNGGQPAPRAPITWLIEPADWSSDELLESVSALRFQEGASNDAVAFIGAPDRKIVSAAGDGLGRPVNVCPSAAHAIARIDAGFVAFLGPGVFLHDTRCASVLASLLKNNAVASASCVLVGVEQGGPVCHFWIADQGTFQGGEISSSPDRPVLAEKLWRSTFPVVSPPKDLWMTDISRARAWLAKRAILNDGEIHLVTSLVTASRVRVADTRGPCHLPEAPAERAITAEILFG